MEGSINEYGGKKSVAAIGSIRGKYQRHFAGTLFERRRPSLQIERANTELLLMAGDRIPSKMENEGPR